MPCATERASRTASAEQHDEAASFSTSAHSSERHRDGTGTHEQRGDRGVDAAAHRDQHTIGVGRHRRARARRRPQRTVQRVAARSAACSFPGDSPPSSSAIDDTPTRAASRHRLAGDQRAPPPSPRRSAPRSPRRRRTPRPPAIAGDPHGDADQIAADRAPGGPVEAPGKHDAAPDGRGEVFTEALAIHERRFYDRRLTAQSVSAGLVELAVELASRRGDDPIGRGGRPSCCRS